MKIMKKLSIILSFVLVAALFFTSCDPNETKPAETNIVPETLTVDIPSSLSSASTVKSATGDIPEGNELYEHMRTFIHAGDEAAQIVEAIITTIRTYNLSAEMSFSYESDDDGRTKNVVITANSEFEGITWDWQMNITDADSEGNDDGGMAMQIFWNTGTVKGISIIKPYNLDRNTEQMFTHAMFRIDYSEAGENGYEQEMTVYISDISLPDASVEPYAMQTMKMTVGKKGNVVEVYGNTNHPNASIGMNAHGINWAFVAAGTVDTDLGVAEVGLPPSDLDVRNREIILGTYSLYNVLEAEVLKWYPDASPDLLAIYLQNATAPAYFNENGFVAAGIAPNLNYGDLDQAIEQLVPYMPLEVSNLKLEFKANVTVK
jgi:hypothetical protein